MADKTKLLLQGLGAIGLDDEAALLKSIGDLATHWVELSRELKDFDSGLALLRAIVEGASDASIKAAFAKINADSVFADLKSGADRLLALIDKLPDSMRKLLNPIGNYNETGGAATDSGLIRWPLIDKAVGAGGQNNAARDPSYALSLGAAAALSVEAGDSWPYNDQLTGPLLRLRADGSLKPKASARLPFTFGSASGSASASVACALEYYFAPTEQKTIYALAVAERLPKLVNPFDFDAVWQGFTQSDLAAIHFTFEGAAKLDLAVAVADAGMLASAVKAELAASIKVGVELQGSYFLSLRAPPRAAGSEPRIVAALSRKRSREGSFDLTLGTTIDLGTLASALHPILARALDKWDRVLKEITPFLSPGTLLKQRASALLKSEAAKLISDQDLRDALVRDVGGALGIGEAGDPQLVAWLEGQLTGGLDAAQGWAENKAQAVENFLDGLGRYLPAFAEAKVRQQLKGTADKLVAKAAEELKARVTQLYQSEADALGKALKNVGAINSEALADADAALAGVRAVISKYDKLFRKVLAATEDAARAKLSIALQIEESRTRAATLELEGTFLRRSDRARAIFHSFTRGNFNSLIRLFEEGGGADFDVDEGRSALKRYAASSSRIGAELVLLDFTVTGGELLSAEASVLVDGTGTVQVDAKASLERVASGLDADREIKLLSSYSLLRARTLATSPSSVESSLGLSITIGHLDKGLKRQEVERFVGSLVAARIIAPTALSTAQTTFTRWSGNPASNGKIGGAIQLKLSLDRSELARLLVLSERGILPQQWRTSIVRTAFDRVAGLDPREDVAATIEFLREEAPARGLNDWLLDPERTRRSLLVEITGSHIPRLPHEHQAFYDAMTMANGLLGMIEELRRIYFSAPEVTSDNDPNTWSAKDYRDAERRAVKAVRDWLQLNTVLFWTNSKVHPRTIAFLDMIAQLSSLNLGDRASLTMWRNDTGTPETIVLSHSAA